MSYPAVLFWIYLKITSIIISVYVYVAKINVSMMSVSFQNDILSLLFFCVFVIDP